METTKQKEITKLVKLRIYPQYHKSPVFILLPYGVDIEVKPAWHSLCDYVFIRADDEILDKLALAFWREQDSKFSLCLFKDSRMRLKIACHDWVPRGSTYYDAFSYTVIDKDQVHPQVFDTCLSKLFQLYAEESSQRAKD